jgi:uncharacterized delta-60 repeat protein
LTSSGCSKPAWLVARLDGGGRLDTTFDGDGIFTHDWTQDFTDVAEAVSIVPGVDGDILVGGFTGVGELALMRLNGSDGSPDTGFGTGGFATAKLSSGDDRIFDIAILGDGSIIATGWTSSVSGQDSFVAKFTAGGSLDTNFGGGDGFVITDQGGIDASLAIAPASGGDIVTAGSANNLGDIALSRYHSQGALDGNFGVGGTVVMDIGATTGEQLTAIVLQADGILATGYACGANSNCDFATARFDPNGGLDAGFGTSGVTRTDLGGYDQPSGLGVQPDGKILVSGTTKPNHGGATLVVQRLTTTGQPDAGFGTNGIATGGVGAIDLARLALQPDGKIVVASHTPLDHILVARFLASGPTMTVTQTHDPEPVTGGSDVRFRVTVVNGGVGSLSGVVLSDETSGTIASVLPSQGSCTTTATTASCALGTILDGHDATVDLYVSTPSAGGTVTNDASATANEHPAIETAAQDVATVDAPTSGSVDAACPPSGCSVTTDPAGSGPTTSQPAVIDAQIPATTGGLTISIDTTPASGASDACGAGATCFGPVIDITTSGNGAAASRALAPTTSSPISPNNPLTLTFRYDVSVNRGGAIGKAKLFLNGTSVPNCAKKSAGTVSPSPACISSRTLFRKSGDYQFVVLSTVGGTWRH